MSSREFEEGRWESVPSGDGPEREVGDRGLDWPDQPGPDRDEDEVLADSLARVYCPECLAIVGEFPASEELVGMLKCPECGEEFDAG